MEVTFDIEFKSQIIRINITFSIKYYLNLNTKNAWSEVWFYKDPALEMWKRRIQ